MESLVNSFESFAVVVTVGILVSLIVSLTLTPMLCARYLKINDINLDQYLPEKYRDSKPKKYFDFFKQCF